MSTPPPTPRLRALEAGVLALALGLRVAAREAIGRTPYAENPLVDAFTYWEQAGALLKGDDPFAEGFYQPPGYPWLLAAWLRLLGGEPSVDAVRVAQLGLGLLTTALLIGLGRRLGQRAAGFPAAGALAGLLYTLYPTTLLFELDLLTPAVTNALLVGGLALIGAEARPGPARALGAGLCLGLAVVVHPTVLIASPVILAGLALSAEAPRWRAPAAWALGLALALAPTTWMNHARWGELALVSHNAGLNFYLGNNPDWRRTAFLRPGLPFRQLVLEAEPDRRDTFARNDYWRERALAELAADPAAWVKALATKALWSVNDREVPRNEDYRCRTRAGPMAWLGMLPARYGWVFPLAVLGALRARRGPALLPMAAGAWLAVQLGVILFLVADRYRLSTWPMICLLAPLGGHALAEALRQGWPPPARAAAFVALCALPWWPIDYITAMQPGWCAHQQGNFALQERRWPEAIAHYEEALRWEPDNIGARHWLGTALAAEGRHAEAALAFEEVLEVFPGSYSTAMEAARAWGRLGDRSREADALLLACAVPGPRDNTCARAVEALLRAGRRAEALALLEQRPALREHERVKRASGAP